MKKTFLIALSLLFVWNIAFAQGFTGDLNETYYIKHATSGKYLTAEPSNPLANGKFVIKELSSITDHESAQFTFTKTTFTETVEGIVTYYYLKTKSGYFFTVTQGALFPNTGNSEYSAIKLTENGGGNPSFYLQIRARSTSYGASQEKYITPAANTDGAIVGVDDVNPNVWILENAIEISPVPVFIGQYPAADAVNASTTADITLTFSKDINWAASPAVTITNNRTGVAVATTGFTSTGKVLAISHAPFDEYEIYTVTIPSGSIANYNSAISWSFSTGIYNIALGKSTETSSFLAPGYTGAKAVDGILNIPADGNPSRWITASDGGIQWLEIDLDGQFAIRYLTIYRDISQGQQKNKEFQVQAWVDNNWVPFVSETDYTASIYSKVLEGELPITNKIRYYVPNYTDNRVRLFEIQIFGYSAIAAQSLVWKGTAAGEENKWDNKFNWEPSYVPRSIDDVTIEANVAKNYPVLSSSVSVNHLTLEAGAEIGRQNYLSAVTTTVNLDLTPDRWHFLSLPVSIANLSAFSGASLSKFTPKGNEAGWESIEGVNTPLAVGEGFALRQEGPGNRSVSVSGPLAAVTAPLSETLSFGSADDRGTDFALAGNPFITGIDFDALYSANTGVIKDAYQVWTAAGAYSGYTKTGEFGAVTATGLDNFIAPLQSFIVEKSAGLTGNTGTLNFNLATVSANATGKGVLRAAEDAVDKLDIIASNGTVDVLTFIANRENANDAGKLKAEINNIPDIYTLKDGEALGANIVSTYDITIPIGIATAYSGSLTLTFKGMDKYAAKITLFDTESESSEGIELTGASSSYPFTYTPKKDAGNQVIPDETRFSLRFASGTGLNDKAIQTVSVYSRDNAIFAVSNSSNLIRQILLYNAQGRLIYANDKVNAPSYIINHQINTPEVCIVKLITEQGVKNVKILIK
jgi:hypothetical protein